MDPYGGTSNWNGSWQAVHSRILYFASARQFADPFEGTVAVLRHDTHQWRICFVWRDGMRSRWKLWIIIEEGIMTKKARIAPVHPEAYLEELLEELGVSQYRLVHDIGVPAIRISHVVRKARPLTAELAFRLGRFFGQSPRYWLNLQSRYDIDVAEDALGERMIREVRPFKVVA